MLYFTHIHAVHIHTHAHMYTHTHASMHARTHARTHAHTCARTHTHTHTHIHTCVHTHPHTCTNTHTHIHTHSHRERYLTLYCDYKNYSALTWAAMRAIFTVRLNWFQKMNLNDRQHTHYFQQLGSHQLLFKATITAWAKHKCYIRMKTTQRGLQNWSFFIHPRTSVSKLTTQMRNSDHEQATHKYFTTNISLHRIFSGWINVERERQRDRERQTERERERERESN